MRHVPLINNWTLSSSRHNEEESQITSQEDRYRHQAGNYEEVSIGVNWTVHLRKVVRVIGSW